MYTMKSNVRNESDESSDDCSDTTDANSNLSYFSSYENLDVHRLMLRDRPRTESYREAMLQNRTLFEGKVVMDVGCGTGILSLFAAEAGACKVYSIEASNVALIARDIVKRNNLQNIIEVFSCQVEDFILPGSEKVDIIISEWMGFYLLHESMLDSVVLARDKFLKESGCMFPCLATIYASPSNLNGFYNEEISFWDNLYGFDFSVVREAVLQNKQQSPQVILVDGSELTAEPEVVKQFDLMNVTVDDIMQFESQFFTSSIQKNICRGIVLWFVCEFPTEPKFKGNLTLSTAPSCPETHWKQTAIVLPTEIHLEAGDVIGFSIKLSQSSSNHRHYNIQVEVLSDEVEHPMPCNCGLARCKLIKAFMKEQHELDDSDEAASIS
ncbi:protein arginine N-methyltransferase 1-like [Dendronephthya gigantea]|uniref:protein arginine N-methyltransferase 1-like n=1 Tax=Dendronephthya gigantea TaxID=151771 RepID=UPI00106DB1C7|nr:protein arginine N-methyltransferase 1-like [Dendronephthya gigantea]